MRRLALCILLLWPLTSLFSQVYKGFTGNAESFMAEAEAFFLFDRNAQKAELKSYPELLHRFALVYESLQEKEQKLFAEMCKSAALANLRPYPGFYQLLHSNCLFFDYGQLAVSYRAYLFALYKIAESRKLRDFDRLVSSSIQIFEEQTLFSSLSVEWKVDAAADFIFEYRDDRPAFVFVETTLRGYAYGDSSCIQLTKGRYYPLSYTWEGQSGLLDYRRAGYDLSEMFIQLNNYDISLRTARFVADSVNFFNKLYFSKALFGRMEEKIMPAVETGKATYPYFQSYDNRLVIKDIFEGVDFEGQYIQAGNRVKCGDKDEEATLTFRQGDKVRMTVSAKSFVFAPQRISSPLARMVISLDSGEIVHPSCELRYDNKKREVSILHSQALSMPNPISNTYHALDMYMEAIYWSMDSTGVEFRMLRIPNREGIGIFESKQSYLESNYQQLFEHLDYNPFFQMRKAVEYYGSRKIDIQSLASFSGLGLSQMKVLLLKMASYGFVVYDGDKSEIEVQDKMFHYLQASAKKSDYDILRIESQRRDSAHAVLDLLTGKMRVFGVEKLMLSQARNVYVIPKDSELTMLRNRDFSFQGFVHSGKFDFLASDCRFFYDEFKIYVSDVESLNFSVKYGVPDLRGEYPLKKVETTIERLTGEIFIDSTNNKSGQLGYTGAYPIFVSMKDAYVYYEDAKIQGGVYDAERFHYIIYPFRLENLNNFKTDSLRFVGRLVSAEIFPDLSEDLRVMPDFSLGFITSTRDTSLPVYGGKARFFDTLSLSNSGLIGKGHLDFVRSQTYSDRFIFMPDSMNASTQTFQVEPQSVGSEYAHTRSKKALQHWEPYRDRMEARSTEESFALFEGQVQFKGTLLVSEGGMRGKGSLQFADGSEVSSDSFLLKSEEVLSDRVSYTIRTKDGSRIAMRGNDKQFAMDMRTKKARFWDVENEGEVFFPQQQYMCYMNDLEWDFSVGKVRLLAKDYSVQGELAMQNKDLPSLLNAEIKGGEFLSLHPKQDHLQFWAGVADYDLSSEILTAQGVQWIKVADIAVFPSDKQVVIEKSGYLQAFKNAKILADTLNQLHEFYNAEVSIKGRNAYLAKGYWDYSYDAKHRQPVFFEHISSTAEGISQATAAVGEQDTFRLNDAFNYFGEIQFTADDTSFFFDGYLQIHRACDESIPSSWIRISDNIMPQEVYVLLSDPVKNDDGKTLGRGFYTTTQGDLLPAFLLPVKASDLPVIQEKEGGLYYDRELMAYRLDKGADQAIPEQGLRFLTTKCATEAYGLLNFQLKYGKLQATPFGRITYDHGSQETRLKTTLGLQFFMDEKLLKGMAENILTHSEKGVEVFTDLFIDFLYSRCAPRDAERAAKELELYGSFRRLPEPLQYTLLLTDLEMVWDVASRSYVSVGPLSIVSMGSQQITKQVGGFVQLIKSRKGDVLNLYIELSRKEWYFFSYSDGVMQVLTGDESYTDLINSTKAAKRKQKGGEGRGGYEYTVSSMRKKNEVVFRAKAIQQGSKEDGTEEEIYEEEEEIVEEEVVEEDVEGTEEEGTEEEEEEEEDRI